MSDTESTVSIQDEDTEQTVSIVTSADDITINGIVGLNPDGSSVNPSTETTDTSSSE